jgi:hypothetical protein
MQDLGCATEAAVEAFEGMHTAVRASLAGSPGSRTAQHGALGRYDWRNG